MDEEAPPLSQGAIWYMFQNETEVEQPILQVLSVRQMGSGANGAQSERHRLVLSDGVHFMQGMLATQLNDIVHTNGIDKNSIIRLNRFASNVVQNRRIIICLELEVLQLSGQEKIGLPANVEQATGDSAPAAAAPPPAPAAAPAAAAAPAPARANHATAASSRAPPAPAPARPAANRGGNAGRAAGGSQGQQPPIFPIEGLSPYQNKWTIKARVMSKSDIRHWHNARGEGKLFSVVLMDDSGEIRATGFGDHVDNFHPMLEEGKVYLISRGKIQIAKKQFSAGVNNEYEIQFDSNTEIDACTDTENLPQIKYTFVPLGNLNDIEKDQLCDVVGVVATVDELASLTSKNGRPFDKRELSLVDETGYQCRVTLFGQAARAWAASDNPIVAFKSVKVSDFGGRSLSMVGAASMQIDPDIPRAHELRGWYDSAGSGTTFASHSNATGGAGGMKQNEFKELADAALLGQGEQAEYFNTRATITFIRPETLSYPACQTQGCNKKVFRETDSEWRCEKCNTSFEQPKHRYVMLMNVADATGSMWLSAFDDVGQLVLGCPADDIERIRDDNPDAIKAEINKRAALKSYNFAVRAKTETYNDTSKVKFSVMRANPIVYVDAGKQYAEEIRAYGIDV